MTTRKTTTRRKSTRRRRSYNRQGIGETLLKSIVRSMGRRLGTILMRLIFRR